MQIVQLASILGVSRNTIANYESGKTEPTTGDLYQIANTLGCQITDFFAPETESHIPRFAFRAHKALRTDSPLIVKARKYLDAYRDIEEITDTKLSSSFRTFAFNPKEMPLEQWIQTAADKTREASGISDTGPEKYRQCIGKPGYPFVILPNR